MSLDTQPKGCNEDKILIIIIIITKPNLNITISNHKYIFKKIDITCLFVLGDDRTDLVPEGPATPGCLGEGGSGGYSWRQ